MVCSAQGAIDDQTIKTGVQVVPGNMLPQFPPTQRSAHRVTLRLVHGAGEGRFAGRYRPVAISVFSSNLLILCVDCREWLVIVEVFDVVCTGMQNALQRIRKLRLLRASVVHRVPLGILFWSRHVISNAATVGGVL